MTPEIGSALIDLLPRLRRFALGLSRSADVADDLVQAACERVLAAAAAGEAIGQPAAFAFRILRNLWVDALRRRHTRGQEVDSDDETLDLAALHADAAADRRLVLGKVAAAIDALPDEQREILLLVCVEEVSYREAAEILALPIGTVMSRLARARRRLAEATGLSGQDL
jgi:RNA polymerase sigma-70 factor (ECF subfamily)